MQGKVEALFQLHNKRGDDRNELFMKENVCFLDAVERHKCGCSSLHELGRLRTLFLLLKTHINYIHILKGWLT